ncbi:hypothetical protein X777_04081 [Ooceraea biroi]|uniref:Peptidase M16C associated domain-containing protein n=1 Tax=Ooceraea biroi TaxID=2015173 RepID=A0A026WIJ0_OOCBI|nr:hypothetical protein X777_04081 [Ooceraea biroi]
MSPVDGSPSGNMGGFELICTFNANSKANAIPFHMYKSTNTGITICIAKVDGPVVSGYFNIVTEAHDDDGLPHTLEHLIFLGSEDYPYKGVLDLWANRCLASGTNAGTYVDRTCYTMSTAGSEGFLSLMPIYLEHILYPTLLDSAFITEVHHITGDGKDAGVVYCEMQDKDNTGECRTYNEFVKAMYPGICGYKSNTGGALINLRNSTSNKKVRQYHKQFYRPENLTLLIAGQVKHADVFRALLPLEQKIMSKGSRSAFQRPWQRAVPPLERSLDLDVYYPCDEEDNGMVCVGWRGPSIVNEIYDYLGCTLLMQYFTSTCISPLQKKFVETDDPYASNVDAMTLAYSTTALLFWFENVPKNKIPLIEGLLVKVLEDTCNAVDSAIDMKRMRTVVHKSILWDLDAFDNNPHDTVEDILFKHVLYGDTKEDLERRLDVIRDRQKLENEPEAYWLSLLKKYFIGKPMVTVKGVPSIEKKRTSTQEEETRIAKQIEQLGTNGLTHKEVELKHAIEENERPIPDNLLTNVAIPSTDSINFHHIKGYSTETSEQHPRFDVTKLPLFTYLDHVNTNFVYLYVIMDTSALSREYRKYVPLLLEVITECGPLRRNDRLIPYEEVVAELEADTVSVSTKIGIGGSRYSCGIYENNVILMLQLELEKYDKGIQWIKELLYDTELTIEKLKVVATKMINDVAQLKRRGYDVKRHMINGLMYNKDSNTFASGMLRQQKFLTELMERLSDDAGQREVMAEITSVRKTLTRLKNMVLFIATNVEKLAAQVPDVYAPWNIHFSDVATGKANLNSTPDWALTNSFEDIPINGCITGVGCIESSFLSQVCPCINDYQHPDLPALKVCLKYLTQAEGPMWRLIRGLGLSYGYGLAVAPNEGLLYLTLDTATNMAAAYKEAKSIVESHLAGDKWDRLLYESAKSSLIYNIIEQEQTVYNALVQSLRFYIGNVPQDYNRQMVRRISAVTMEDMTRVATLYLKPLFDPKKCKTAVVCHPSKIAELDETFKQMNQNLKLYNCLEETYLSEW